jgi:Zn-dependent protease
MRLTGLALFDSLAYRLRQRTFRAPETTGMSDELYRPEPPIVQPEPLDIDDIAIAPEDAAVLAELEQLQNQRPSWWGGLVLLAVSLFLYMGVSRAEQTWEGVCYLVLVILFHELGHFVAMRIFGYRNLRMFFIPFFGAAVTGRHYNVAGWKKAVVALMGPLPGILIGVPLGIAGLSLGQRQLTDLALLMLILNGFNLLPFLPLDGGWIVHAILFVRHPLLDVTFRVLAALALIGVAIMLGAWLLVGLGVVMLLGMPMTWRIARIAYNLGQQGVVALSPDAESIPLDASLPILAELRQALPPQTPPKVLAQNVANVFETLNAYPPGVLASIGLLAVHVGAFAAALVLTALLVVLRQAPG